MTADNGNTFCTCYLAYVKTERWKVNPNRPFDPSLVCSSVPHPEICLHWMLELDSVSCVVCSGAVSHISKHVALQSIGGFVHTHCCVSPAQWHWPAAVFWCWKRTQSAKRSLCFQHSQVWLLQLQARGRSCSSSEFVGGSNKSFNQYGCTPGLFWREALQAALTLCPPVSSTHTQLNRTKPDYRGIMRGQDHRVSELKWLKSFPAPLLPFVTFILP